MTRNFVHTAPFRKCWDAMGLNDEELVELEKILLENPHAGVVIENTGGARKLRIPLSGRGKRGGGRVIYVDIFERQRLYLLFAYPKNVQENLSPAQTKLLRELVDVIKKGEM